LFLIAVCFSSAGYTIQIRLLALQLSGSVCSHSMSDCIFKNYALSPPRSPHGPPLLS